MNKLAILPASVVPLLIWGCLDSGPGSPAAPKNADPEIRAQAVQEIIEEPSGLKRIKGMEAPRDTFALAPDSNFLRSEKLASNRGPMRALSPDHAFAKIAEGEPYIILYQNIDYGGAQFYIQGSLDYNALAFSEAGDWNDKVSSIKFFNGAQAHFWVANDYKGGFYTWSANIPDLRVHTFNDVLSSVSWDLPVKDEKRYVYVCTDPGCRTGGKTTLYFPLDYNRLPRWEGEGEFNNTISEIYLYSAVPEGKSISFYTGDSWTGSGCTFTVAGYNALPYTLPTTDCPYNNQFSSLTWVY